MKNSHYYLCMLHVWCKFWMLDNLWVFRKSQITVNFFQVGPLKWQKLPNLVWCVSHQAIFSCQGVVIKRWSKAESIPYLKRLTAPIICMKIWWFLAYLLIYYYRVIFCVKIWWILANLLIQYYRVIFSCFLWYGW